MKWHFPCPSRCRPGARRWERVPLPRPASSAFPRAGLPSLPTLAAASTATSVAVCASRVPCRRDRRSLVYPQRTPVVARHLHRPEEGYVHPSANGTRHRPTTASAQAPQRIVTMMTRQQRQRDELGRLCRSGDGPRRHRPGLRALRRLRSGTCTSCCCCPRSSTMPPLPCSPDAASTSCGRSRATALGNETGPRFEHGPSWPHRRLRAVHRRPGWRMGREANWNSPRTAVRRTVTTHTHAGRGGRARS